MSDRGTALLDALRRQVSAWSPVICRAVHARAVTIDNKPQGEFAVLVCWDNKDGTKGEHRHEFTRQRAFGGTFSLSPNAWSVERKACDHARDIIRAVLEKRGIT